MNPTGFTWVIATQVATTAANPRHAMTAFRLLRDCSSMPVILSTAAWGREGELNWGSAAFSVPIALSAIEMTVARPSPDHTPQGGGKGAERAVQFDSEGTSGFGVGELIADSSSGGINPRRRFS
jgi:hypothetical protein